MITIVLVLAAGVAGFFAGAKHSAKVAAIKAALK